MHLRGPLAKQKSVQQNPYIRMPRHPISGFAWLTCLIFPLISTPAMAEASKDLEKSLQQLKHLPLEELLSVEVTTVAKRPERLVDSPSAVQVITSEDILRSG